MKKFLILWFISFSTVYCDSLSIIFLGDTHFGENYQYDPKFNHGFNAIAEFGYDHFFQNVKDILNGSDITFCNLETPLINLNSSTTPVSLVKPYLHWSHPDSAVKYLLKYNIKNVTLGNNHVFDYSLPGFASTVNALDSSVISYFGAGYDSSSASKPFIKDINGYKLIIFSGFEYRAKYDTLYDFYAGENKPGVNKLDTVKLSGAIKKYRNEYPEAHIIIYPHWGNNYKPATEQQRTLAHNYINAGADCIIGQGAHTIQEAELYKGKWIFYNIGNFIFNAPGRYLSTGAKPFGIILKMIITKAGYRFILIPVFTKNSETDYSIRQLDEAETNDLLKIMFGNSDHYIINAEGFIEVNF